MQARQILVVDDDPEDRMIIQEAMEIVHKADVIFFAENGEQAIDILTKLSVKNQLPCLVVLDLNMPKLNGTETLKYIRKKEEFKDVRVVVYSTSINPLEKETCLQLGAQEFMTKPVSFEGSKATAKKLLDLCGANSAA